jgi:hypothetical protein
MKDAIRQRGATMVELAIAMPMFVMLIFVIAELGLMYQAKSLLDVASLAAARAGAVNGGDPGRMRATAANTMSPLYAPGRGLAGAALASRTDAGIPHAVGSTSTMPGPGTSTINSAGGGAQRGIEVGIISPTSQMVQDFRVNRTYRKGQAAVAVIPNDNLMYRSTALRNGVNVQDANLLKIRVTYLYETKMPLTRYFFTPFMNSNLTAVIFGGEAEGGAGMARDTNWRIPLVSYATVRMQSDFREGSLSAAAPGGSGGGWSGLTDGGDPGDPGDPDDPGGGDGDDDGPGEDDNDGGGNDTLDPGDPDDPDDPDQCNDNPNVCSKYPDCPGLVRP